MEAQDSSDLYSWACVKEHDSSLGHGGLLGHAGSPASPGGPPRSPAVPEGARDGEGVHANSQGLGGDGAELLPVRAVLIDGLHLGGADRPRTDSGQSHKLLGVGVHGVDAAELAAGVPEEDEEMVGWALLHFLEEENERREEN